MKFTLSDLDIILKLSALQMDDNKKNLFLSQLDNIINYISQLEEINVDNIEPMTHPLETQYLHPNIGVEEFFDKDLLIQNNIKHNIKNNGIVIKSPIKN